MLYVLVRFLVFWYSVNGEEVECIRVASPVRVRVAFAKQTVQCWDNITTINKERGVGGVYPPGGTRSGATSAPQAKITTGTIRLNGVRMMLYVSD